MVTRDTNGPGPGPGVGPAGGRSDEAGRSTHGSDQARGQGGGASREGGSSADDIRQRAEDQSIDHDNPLAEVYEDQLLAADLIVLNKTDLLDDQAVSRLRSEIAAVVPRGKAARPILNLRRPS